MKKLVFLILLALTSSAFASGWSTQALKLCHEYKHPIEDGAISSIWGNLMPIVSSKLQGHPGVTIRTRQIPSRHFKTGHIEFIESWPEDGFFKKRPFIIFNPGVFSPIWGDQTTDMMTRLGALGYHVIAFANPLDRDFVTLNPKFEVGNIYKQAQAIYEASKYLINEYDRAGYVKGKPRLAGVSYGTFLTALIAAQDTQANNPIGFRDLTLFSPPFVLTESIGLLDKLILDSRDDGYEFSNWSMLKSFWHILWLKGITRAQAMDSRLSLEARGILGEYVFKSGMARALKELDELTGVVGVPKRRKERRKWRESLLFSEIFNKYSPKFSQSFEGSEGEHLITWLAKAREHGIGIRVLTAKDDFINARVPSDGFAQDELIELERGGHYGYRSLEWFTDLVNLAFDPRFN